MSLAVAHFGVGVSITCFLILITRTFQNESALFLPYFGGFASMLPDTWRFVPGLPSNTFDTPLMNVFFGHHYIDTYVDPGDTITFAALCVGLMLFAICSLTTARYFTQPE